MNKENKHIINILKLNESDEDGLKEILKEINFEENDDIVKILKELKSNPHMTGFEMFGDSYYSEFDNFNEELIKIFENETCDNVKIIDTNDENSIEKLLSKVNFDNIYELKYCLMNIDEEEPFLAIDKIQMESYVFKDIFEVFDCFDINANEYHKEIKDIWNNYDFFDLGMFFRNYYPNDEILESQYGNIIIKLLKYYNSICLEDKDKSEKLMEMI